MVGGVEDSGDALLKAVQLHADDIRSKISSQKEYDDLVAGLTKIAKAEAEKG